MSLLQIQSVSKMLGSHQILKDVTFEIKRGEVVTLLGPNGAGKTTLISLCTGLRQPDTGHVHIEGQSVQSVKGKSHFSVSPQECDFPKYLKVSEVLEFYLKHFVQSSPMDEMIKLLSLDQILNRQTGALSGGQKRRLSLACTFGSNADLLFLDEPSAGLDVETRRALWSLIRKQAQQKRGVLLTTHYLEEAEALSDRVVVIHQGKILFQGQISELKGKFAKNKVVYSLNGQSKTELAHDTDAFVRNLVKNNVAFENLQIMPATLEESFINLVGQS